MHRAVTALALLPLSLLPSSALALSEGAAGLPSTTDPVSRALVGTIIVAVFALLALEKVHRVLVVMGAVTLLWAITYLTPFRLISFEGSARALDFNVIFLLASMMAVVGVLKTTGVFEWAVARIMGFADGNAYVLLAAVTWFTAILSAFCDNVTTVIFVAPMVLQMARVMGVSPVAYLLPVVMASNIGGTATLIGDPPNIMIGSGANLAFMEFIVNLTPPVIAMMFLLPWVSARFYRDQFAAAGERLGATARGEPLPVPPITDPRLLNWGLWISGLIFLGFFTHALTGMPTAVPATIGAGALLIVQDVLYLRTHRPTHEERTHGLLTVIEREIEWPTLIFFAFLFIAVGAAVQTGLIDTLAVGLARVIQGGSGALGLSSLGTVLFAALLIAWVSGVLSAIIDNIPFVAVMIPIIHRLADQLPGETAVLWWALALGACLGGNGTAVGASANVTALGIAERQGVRISFREFTRFGSVVATYTLVVSSVFLASQVYLGARTAALAWTTLVVVVLAVLGTRRLLAHGIHVRPTTVSR
jgi:Na+/H+ antiporter NhaD/arsenite permease-like protein